MFIYKLRFFNILRYSYARVSKVTVLLSVFLFLGVVPQALAATYYVATTGNDANPGTPTAPFQTIKKAANVVNPGDTDGFLGWNVTNIQIVGNHIHDIGRLCTATAYGPAGMYFHAGSDILVEQNLIHDIGRYQLGENGCTLGDARHDHAIYIDGTN